MKILIDEQGRKYFFKGNDIHTKFGFVKSADITKAKAGKEVQTHKGKKFIVLDANFLDKFSKIKRLAQIIPLKDLGVFVAEIGLETDWKIVDAGSGSGALACFLANLVPKGKVFTYDVREDHLNVVKENITFLELKNITAKIGDVYKKIPHKNMDLITLDLAEPWNAVDNCVKALKPGGFIVCYSPCVPQVSDFVEALRKKKELFYLKTVEIILREWDFEQRKIRPKSQPIGHSGFITIARKV